MVYRSLLRPLLFSLPPETAHELALHSLSSLLTPGPLNRLVTKHYQTASTAAVHCLGLTFSNPIGLAAGFDKDGIALDGLAALGFGFIEAGTVTYHPQPGNPRPRLFRLPKDRALINRAGFNNEGAAALASRVKARHPSCVLGVSIGKSKIAPIESAIEDYLASFELVYPIADYIAINVSSPNTPQLRELQQADQLSALLQAIQERNEQLKERLGRSSRMPVLVKLAPDLEGEDLELIVSVIDRQKIDGLIATNTTISRENLRTPATEVQACGQGGLSGEPLKSVATNMIATLYQLTQGHIPIIGVGGIFNAGDAWEKICAGASLLQIYTGFIYQGPGIVRDINKGLAEIMKRERFDTLSDAVGSRAAEFVSKVT